MTKECKFLVAGWAAEWLFTSVSILMYLQITKQWRFLVTGWAAEWFFTSMISLMFFEMTKECKFLVAGWAAKLSFTIVNSLNFYKKNEVFSKHLSFWMLCHIECKEMPFSSLDFSKFLFGCVVTFGARKLPISMSRTYSVIVLFENAMVPHKWVPHKSPSNENFSLQAEQLSDSSSV